MQYERNEGEFDPLSRARSRGLASAGFIPSTIARDTYGLRFVPWYSTRSKRERNPLGLGHCEMEDD